MANILEYTLSLQDKLSAKLRKIGVNNDVALDKFAALEDQSQKVAEGFNKLGNNVSTLKSKIDLLKNERDLLPIENISNIRAYNSEIKSLEKEVSKLENINGNRVKTWFSDALNSLPRIATNPLVLLGAGITKAVQQGMRAEHQKGDLEILLQGDVEAATALYDKISSYSIKAPYDKSDLVSSQQKLMEFGFSANEAFETLQQIGDVAAGDASRLGGLTSTFAKLAHDGELTDRRLRQLKMDGFDPLVAISQKTGESMDSLWAKMEDGKIGVNEVTEAFKLATQEGGKFHNGALDAANSLEGRWKNMTKSMTETGIKIYGSLEPLLMPLVDLVAGAFDLVAGGIGWFVDKVKEGDPYITALIYTVGAFTAVLALYRTQAALATLAQNKLTLAVIKSNLAFLASPVGIVAAIIGVLVGAIVLAWNKSEGFRKVILGLWEVIKSFGNVIKDYVINRFKELLSGITGIGKALWSFFKGDWKEAWETGKKAAADLSGINSGKKALSDAVNAGKKIGENYSKGAAKGAESWAKSQKKPGINMPAIPGMSNFNHSSIGSRDKTENTKTGETAQAIATGGQKTTNVTISLDNLIGILNISGRDFDDSTNQMQDQTTDAMLRVLAMALSAGT